MKRKVLFLCTGNSCRSQMAEAIVNSQLGEIWEAHSAGARPDIMVNPYSVRALAEIDIVHDGHTKHVNDLRDELFDLVVTLCDYALSECPTFSGHAEHVHLGINDPAQVAGNDRDVLAAHVKVRVDINLKVVRMLEDWCGV